MTREKTVFERYGMNYIVTEMIVDDNPPRFIVYRYYGESYVKTHDYDNMQEAVAKAKSLAKKELAFLYSFD